MRDDSPGRRSESATDEELMSRVASGDARAFAELHGRHRRQAYFVAYRILGDGQEAEDAVQDAFVRVWKGAGGYHPEKGRALAWILAAVRHRAVDVLRSRRARRRAWERAASVAPLSQPDEAFPALWRKVSLEGRRGPLREALGALPPDQREVLALTHVEGLTQTEIAARLRLPLGTVKGRVRCAMGRLRAQLAVAG